MGFQVTMRVRKLIPFIPLLLLACSSQSVNMSAITEIANVDSVQTILSDLEDERVAQPDPNTNVARRIYSERILKFRLIDSLAATHFPVFWANTLTSSNPDSFLTAKLDSLLLRYDNPDSTDDRGQPIAVKIRNFLDKTPQQRKDIMKAQIGYGKILYVSRNDSLILVEQFNWAILSGNFTRRIALKKYFRGRLWEGQGNIFTAYKASDPTSFDNRIDAVTAGYIAFEDKDF